METGDKCVMKIPLQNSAVSDNIVWMIPSLLRIFSLESLLTWHPCRIWLLLRTSWKYHPTWSCPSSSRIFCRFKSEIALLLQYHYSQSTYLKVAMPLFNCNLQTFQQEQQCLSYESFQPLPLSHCLQTIW